MLERGGNGLLPPGEHVATLDEVEEAFATNLVRRRIMQGLRQVVAGLTDRGVKHIWVDGSFVTNKRLPSDVDVVFVVPPGENTSSWGWLSFAYHTFLKDLCNVDLWPYPSFQPSPGGMQTIVDFFQSDVDGTPKGIVVLLLAI